MNEPGVGSRERRFETAEEELAHLRERVGEYEREANQHGLQSPESAAREAVRDYAGLQPEIVLHPVHQIEESLANEIALGLVPEEHDRKVSELIGFIHERGIKNTLSIISKMNDPHLADDLERYLVQYIKAGFPIEGLKETDPVFKALSMTLYEITLPELGEGEGSRQNVLKELVATMEHFYSGMLSVSNESVGPGYYTLELAVANHSSDFIFYSAVPNGKRDLFEKHILAAFPMARVTERKDDYNIFNEQGESLVSVASLQKRALFPIKTYHLFEHDPLSAIMNAFSKIDHDGEGAAIQIVIKPSGSDRLDRYKKMIDDITKGADASDVLLRPETVGEHALDFAKAFGRELFSFATAKKKVNKVEKDERQDAKRHEETLRINQGILEVLKRKVETPIVETNIRLVVSSNNEHDAAEILTDLESAFNQFELTEGNRFVFTRPTKATKNDILHRFSYRLFVPERSVPLSLGELGTILHFPKTTKAAAPHLKVAKSATAPAPAGMPTSGVLLGINRDRGGDNEVHMAPEDRLRHLYVIGQTGTGKTTLLKQMIVQDIKNGDGVCFIDPHGSDIQDILANVPKERYEDVIYFDPGYVARPMALNMLEYDGRYPEQKTFVVNEMLSIFNKLFDMKTAGGPMFEQYFRNAAMLVIDDPKAGATLLDLSRVFADKAFRAEKLATCTNPIVVQFWREIAEKAGGEASLANMIPYITSKFDGFLSNDIMRPIIAQAHSSFNFREVMDNKKILLVNLSKGRLGDINSHLIGLILVGKILMAALSRADAIGAKLPAFYLYVDEFQNVTTDSIATILSEARKYRLSLHIAHQFIGQLPDNIKNSVFGNVGSMAAFRVGAEDAEFLEKQFAPVFSATDLINVDNHNAFVRMLVGGKPTRPFNIETLPLPSGRTDHLDNLKELSYLKFGRQRSEVEAEIMAQYKKTSVQKPVTSVSGKV